MSVVQVPATICPTCGSAMQLVERREVPPVFLKLKCLNKQTPTFCPEYGVVKTLTLPILPTT